MIETIHRPRTWEELFALENFTRDPVPKDYMIKGTLRGDYDMGPKAGQQPCGIEKCHKLHGKGFVVVLPDGRKSNVGKDCGKTKFGAAWTRMRSDYSRLKREHNKITALQELRIRLLTLVADWPNLDTPQSQRARRVLAAVDRLPNNQRRSIENRAAQNDVKVFVQRYETADEVRQREFHTNSKHTQPRLLDIDLGKLRGLNALKLHLRVDTLLDTGIPQTIAHASEIARSPSSTTEMIGQAIVSLTDIQTKLDTSIKHLEELVEPHNLALLCRVRAFQTEGVRSIAFVDGMNPEILLKKG